MIHSFVVLHQLTTLLKNKTGAREDEDFEEYFFRNPTLMLLLTWLRITSMDGTIVSQHLVIQYLLPRGYSDGC